MKVFTKCLLTFMLLCVANGVNAQKVWQKVFSQGWCHEWRTDDAQTDGPAQKEGDAYKVFCRSSEQADAAGNAILDNGSLAGWDSQFFVTWDEVNALEVGDKIKVTMKVKADRAVSIGTQAHRAPGQYNHWQCVGNVDFTEDWTDFDSGEVEVSSDMASGDSGQGFWAIAFNLSDGQENNFYFKDIVVEIYASKKTTKTVVSEKFEWKQLVVNGDAEGDDVSAFFTRTYPYTDGEPSPHSVIENGKGVDGSRAVVVTTNDKVENAWDTQFWIKLNEELPAGAKIRTKFNYRADEDASAATQSHTIKPGENSYIHYEMIGNIGFTTDWQDFEDERSISASQSTAEKPMGSIAFNLNDDSHPEANVYYFDNVSVEVGALVNDIQHYSEGIRVLFTAYTNIPDLIVENANGKRRLVIDPADSPIKVTVDGAEMPIGTIEYDREGQLYIFPDDDFIANSPLEEQKIVVKFANPEGAKYRIMYTNGDKAGQPVEDFEQESVFVPTLDFLPFAWGMPELQSSDPEEGSFNLAGTINTFKATFDKSVQCKFIKAKLDGTEDLTVEYAAEEGDEITLKRAGSDALADGNHTISILNVYSSTDANRYEAASATINFSVGAPKLHDDLVYALDKAKATLEDNESERYAGAAYNALKEAVEKYESEGVNYTSPTVVKAAANDISLKEQNLKDHHSNCDIYDESIENAVNVVNDFSESKFATTELFAELKALVAKYEGKVLTDDEELQAAVAELENTVAKGTRMFTEGQSNNGDAGIKVLVERIRRGAEALKTLGVSEGDELIVAADNAMSDDDNLAKAIKNRLAMELFGKIKDGTADALFEDTYDEEGNAIAGGVDLSVFVKNPNMYSWNGSKGINQENTPGWSLLSGNMGLWGDDHDENTNWGTPYSIDGLPSDCVFTIYHSDTRAEQTIEGLPAGKYLVTFYGTDWGNMMENNGVDALGFVYAKTSDTPAVEEGAEEDRDVNFAATTTAFYAEPQYSMVGEHNLEVEVKDGKLIIGLQFGNDSQYFFGDVSLKFVGALEGYDYAKAYEEILTGISSVKASQKGGIIYDLSGRRVKNPTKGFYVTEGKKFMVK